MKFEIGHYYQHTGGRALAVRGCIPTTLYGEHTLIAEEWPSNREAFLAVGKDEESTVNYREISEAEWLKLWEPNNRQFVDAKNHGSCNPACASEKRAVVPD